jgi:dienelactone hydrolase
MLWQCVKGGRTRELCDKLSDAGYMVLLPDFFRGESRVSSHLKGQYHKTLDVRFLFSFLKQVSHINKSLYCTLASQRIRDSRLTRVSLSHIGQKGQKTWQLTKKC